MTKRLACKDCGSFTRKLTPPGPRCASCHRDEKKRRKAAAHDRYVGNRYGLPPGMYERLYEAQGGFCALCRRATGATKHLAVDHDHSCCAGKESCGRCVRGLLCGPCNDVLAVARDSADYFLGAIAYLATPPAKEVLNASLPRVLEGRQSDSGGPVVQAPEGGTEVRRERNHGSEPALPGVDEYAAILDDAYRNTRDAHA